MGKIAIEAKNIDLAYKFVNSINIKQELKRMFSLDRTKRNPSRTKEILALKNISFSINEGSVVGIIGTNGSGKSTLLKVVAQIIEPDAGSICVHSESVSLLALGTGFQTELSGLENIYINGLLLGLRKIDIDAKLEEIIDFSELWEFIHYPVGKYSSGMRARLAFSIACHVDPEVLLIDEVLGVGDEAFKEKSQQRIKNMIRENRTVLIVSHSIPTLKEICDKVMWLHKGELIEYGETDVVLDKYTEFIRALKRK